jgi:hypothetical protein
VDYNFNENILISVILSQEDDKKEACKRELFGKIINPATKAKGYYIYMSCFE